MKWIGLTGGIACGKSEVARLLATSGVPVVHADQVAHRAFVPQTPTFNKVVEIFGNEILDDQGEIHRGRLGAKVFSDPKLRSQLEAIVHPFVQSEVARERRELAAQGQAWAVYEVPLLFEKNLEKSFDQIVVVGCGAETQLQRLMSRNQLSKADAELRINSQWPLEKKRNGADFVIENNGSLDDLAEKVRALRVKIEALSPLSS